MRCARCNNNLDDQATICERCGLIPAADGKDPLIGSVIGGEYQVIKRIGAGGMGTVYLGKWLAFGQNVAIKILHSRAANSFATAKRFELEARTYAKLNHHNLVYLRAYGQTPEGIVYMVLEFCPGETLSKMLRTRQKLPPLMAIEFCLQIAAGLVEAHAQHIVHRDLKPDNIMVETMPHNSYHLKLLDFGIAKNIAQDEGLNLTSAQTAVGTPEYMAPEQARGLEVDGRTDIYALGIVLYELVCGRPPFIAQNGNKFGVMTDQTSTLPPPPHVFTPDIPPELEALILRCLEKVPDHRYQTASDLIAALTQVQTLIKDAQNPTKKPTEKPMIEMPSEDYPSKSPSTALKLPYSLSQTLDSRPISHIDAPHSPTHLQLAIGLAVFIALIALVALFTGRTTEPPADEDAPETTLKALPAFEPGAAEQQTALSWMRSLPQAFEEEQARHQAQLRAKQEESDRLAQEAAEQKRLQEAAEQKRAQEMAQRNQEAKASKENTERALNDYKKARKLLRSGDFEEAADLLEEALKRKPDLSKADQKSFQELRSDLNRLRSQLSMARLSYDSKDYAQALEQLTPLTKAAPEAKNLKKMADDCRRHLSD